MKNPSVKELFGSLSSSEKDELLELLQDESLISEVLGMSDARPDGCRCCGSKKFVRNGKETVSGRQRYLCRDCRKSFTSMTGTLIS